jgi:ABC-type nitrate/sulfonate/bicarbonate transport system substrate-binding protein
VWLAATQPPALVFSSDSGSIPGLIKPIKGEMKRFARFFLIILVVALVLAAWLRPEFPLPGRQTGKESEPPAQAALAYVNTTHAVLAGIALHKGYYRQEGLEVTPRLHSYGKTALEDMLAGNADFATVADPPIMEAIMNGEKIFILATIQTSNRDNAIVARKDAGIFEPEDLKGKRIGATLGTTSDFYMDAYLQGRGIAREEVEKVGLKPKRLQEALSTGRVDAVSAFQPFLIQIQQSFGDQVVSFYDETIYTWTFSVVAKQEYVRNNPVEVKKLLRALVDAEDFVQRHPAEAQQIVADYSGMDLALVREIWANMKFKVTLDQFLVLALEDESRWAITSGIITDKEIPNYLDFVYFEGLESVKPEAVRILR